MPVVPNGATAPSLNQVKSPDCKLGDELLTMRNENVTGCSQPRAQLCGCCRITGGSGQEPDETRTEVESARKAQTISATARSVLPDGSQRTIAPPAEDVFFRGESGKATAAVRKQQAQFPCFPSREIPPTHGLASG